MYLYKAQVLFSAKQIETSIYIFVNKDILRRMQTSPGAFKVKLRGLGKAPLGEARPPGAQVCTLLGVLS